VRHIGWGVTRHRFVVWQRILLFGVVTVLPLLGAVAVVQTRPGAPVPGWVNPVPFTGTPYVVKGDASGLPPPDRLRIPSIGVDSGLESLELDSAGALKPPVDFIRAGWYSGGPAPGDVGPAVIAGHVDSQTGRAVFYRLRELRAGDTVEVSRGGQWLSFRVVATETHSKKDFPTNEVYRPTPLPELRLITCGGSFDWHRRSYVDNIIVYAVVSPS
jgi:LPXTG-site transpeptidase (sortase) family protein